MTLPNLTNVAIIFLALHAFVGIFVPLVLLYLSMRGMMAANRKLREVMPRVQHYARQAAEGSEAISQRVTEPIVKVYGVSTRWQASWQRATAPFHTQADGSIRRNPAAAAPPADRAPAADPATKG